MFIRSRITKTKGVALTIVWFVVAFLLIQSNIAFGGGWNPPWKKSKTMTNSVGTHNTSATGTIDEGAIANEQISPAVTLEATVPKLFWVDCGPQFDCTNATLWYVDPSSITPAKTLFDSSIFVTVDLNEAGAHLIEPAILTFTLDPTGKITNMKIAYVFYFKGGMIWLVDTTTLTPARRLSTESGIYPDTLCEVQRFENWQNPNGSTIYYRLKGPDGQCYTEDDIVRAVKVGMTPKTPPINIPKKEIHELLLNGKYIVMNYSSDPPWIVEICSSDLTTPCTPIDTFTNDADTEDYDKNKVVLLIDGKLKRYNYGGSIIELKTCYTPDSNEHVGGTALDKDGYIYFSTIQEVSPFTNTIKKVLCGNTPQPLASFTASAKLPYLDIAISPTHVVYLWPNTSNDAEHVCSVLKGGGVTPVVISNTCINGGYAGQYYFCEDTTGNVHRIKLDGSETIKRANSQLNGYTLGGSAFWYYDVNPSTFRVFLSNISNSLKSYAIDEDFRDVTKGISMGTVPVNLSNFGTSAAVSLDMLGIAMKRYTNSSYGTDILLLKATTPSSLKRLTNSNAYKLFFEN